MNKEEIDFVIPWVDGKDKNWYREKRKYEKYETREKDNNEIGVEKKLEDSEVNERFRDWGILKYWFRSVEINAPWVRKIHFVTWGHLPNFLNAEHEKIHIVNHRDYIPEEYLPTFSANPIEVNMHRIKGLADQFVYFNDDMFLNKKVSKKDFFVDGKPCYEALEATIKANDVNEIYNHILLNDISVINEKFSKREVQKKYFFKWYSLNYGLDIFRNICLSPWSTFQCITNSHLAAPFLKQTLFDVWKEESEILEKTSANKFRSIYDVNQYLFRYWDIMRGNFVPRKRLGKAYHIGIDSVDDAVNAICAFKGKVICINDTSYIDDFEGVAEKIRNAFEKRYPNKSTFEK